MRPLDEATVDLHRVYHDKTVEFTMHNIDWVQSKAYGTDGYLSKEESATVARSARARLQRWPRIDVRDMHKVALGPQPQRFCSAADGATLGDPMDNVFVISLGRRPTKRRRAVQQLLEARVSATLIDAVDGDAFARQEDITRLGVQAIPGYAGHVNHDMPLTTGEVGCFMSHYAIWYHMVENGIPSALILEDDFDLQEDFAQRLGVYLEEARGENWNLMYVGRSPMEGDWRRVSAHVVEPGYTLWTVGYIIRLDAALALLEAQVERRMAPLDDYFTMAMGKGYDGKYNDQAQWWKDHIPVVLRGLAVTPPLVMPYVGSMFLSDTAMLREGTRYVRDLPTSVLAVGTEEEGSDEGAAAAAATT